MDSQLFIAFGATGDLMRRKLVPALYSLLHRQSGDGETAPHILGVARSDWSDAVFQQEMRAALAKSGFSEEDLARWCDERLAFHPLQETADGGHDFGALRERVEEIEAERGLPGNRVFYLSLPPPAYGPTVEGLGKAGLTESDGWARLVVEKPFGHDLASAQNLNERVHQHFGEEQVYRIDHYLGKETVQNLLAFRFGNALFESVWDREHVERVEITVAEADGVGTRAGYYDDAGHLRDMVQNHLTQLFCLVAMEPPSAFTADAIRREKVKVLDSVRSIDPDDVVLGRYAEGKIDGEPVPAYTDEEGVPDDSDTETFAALTLRVDNWRWQGVPFRLKTGKRLPEKRTQIAVHFRCAPVSLFENQQAGNSSCGVAPNVLVITLQPDEGFDLSFEVKRPGEALELDTQTLSFRYEDAFGPAPEAYETLLRDIMRGDQTLFVRADEVEASWKLYDPLLEAGLPLRPYPAGSWGPAADAQSAGRRAAAGGATSNAKNRRLREEDGPNGASRSV
jgi:glucose-6-phosphate 1-dehydrogenase